jgi:Flp pilus assembly protein TadD
VIDLKRVRPLDAAIAAVLAVVLVLGGYLGYSVWAGNRRLQDSTIVSRGLSDLIAAVRQNPDDLALRMKLAQAFAVAGRRNDAVKQYEQILEVREDYAPALAGLGTIALREKQWRTAEGYYRKALEIFQQSPGAASVPAVEQAHFYLATALMEQKEYEEAAANFKEAARLKRDSSTTHYLLAVCLREMGLDEAYREALGNALLFDPKHPEANYDYGMILLAQGDEATAAEHFRTSADAAPNVAFPRDALAGLGTAEQRLAAARGLAASDPGQAIVEARVAVALEPRSVSTLMMLADLYAEAGNAEKARDLYKRTLLVDPENDAAKAGLERVGDGS